MGIRRIRQYQGNDQVFLKACELAEVKPTHRQHRKYERSFGSAHSKRKEAHAAYQGGK